MSLEMVLQLGAYFGATHYRENGPGANGWQLHTVETHPTAGAIIKIGPEYVGVAEREVWENGQVVEIHPMQFTQAELETAFNKFQHCLEIFWWLEQHGQVKIPAKEAYQFEGRQLVSVTYVLQHVIAKPGLLAWYARMGQEGKDPNAERDKRGAEGTLWHKHILYFLQGRKVDLTNTPESLTAVMAKFAAWQQSVRMVPRLLESRVAHPELGYGGTVDAIAQCVLPETHVTHEGENTHVTH